MGTKVKVLRTGRGKKGKDPKEGCMEGRVSNTLRGPYLCFIGWHTSSIVCCISTHRCHHCCVDGKGVDSPVHLSSIDWQKGGLFGSLFS